MIFITGVGFMINLIFIYFIYHHHRQLTDLQKKTNELDAMMGKHQMEQAAVVNADLIFAKQLAEINRQLVSMENQLQSQGAKRSNDGGYQHALRILEMGGSKEEIVSSCHLSNAEAELLMNLHAYRAAIKTVV